MSLFKIIRLDTVETLYGIQKRAHYFFFKSCNQQSWCKTSSKHLTLDFPGNEIFRSTIFFLLPMRRGFCGRSVQRSVFYNCLWNEGFHVE